MKRMNKSMYQSVDQNQSICQPATQSLNKSMKRRDFGVCSMSPLSRRLQLPSTEYGSISRTFRMCWDVMNGSAIHHQRFLFIAPSNAWPLLRHRLGIASKCLHLASSSHRLGLQTSLKRHVDKTLTLSNDIVKNRSVVVVMIK